MLSIAQDLIAASIEKADVKILAATPLEWMDRAEKRQAQFVLQYYGDHHELPKWEDVTRKFHLKDDPSKGRPEFYFRELKNRYITAEIADKVPAVLKTMRSDPMESLDMLKELVAGMVEQSSVKKVLTYSEAAMERYHIYEEKIGKGGVTHLSTGVPLYDKRFYGYKPTDLITIGGRSGVKKTWLLLWLCHLLAKWLDEKEDSRDVLFVSNELPEEEIVERLDCIRYELPYGDFMGGHLTRKQREAYREGLSALEKTKSRVKIIYNVETLEDLQIFIGIYKPAMVFVDGSYLMSPPRKVSAMWEAITLITTGLKRIAKETRIPIANTTQLTKGAGKSKKKISVDEQDEFAFAQSYVRDSDIAFRNYQDKEMVFDNLIGQGVAKGRRVEEGTTFMLRIDLYKMKFEVMEEGGTAEPEVKDEEDPKGPVKTVKW